MKKNVGTLDRFIRISIGATALVAGYFWLYGLLQVLAYSVGIIATGTGLVAYCGLYALCKKSTCQIVPSKSVSKKSTILLILFLFILLVIESFGSIIMTRKKLLENFNHMNGYYKQTLFLTGQLKRDEARVQYDLWKNSFSDFFEKYNAYRPYVLRNDDQFTADLDSVAEILRTSKDGVYGGDLSVTHKKLEEVRPIFQVMFKRNGFTMESMALVDFHDLMEVLITAADAKDAPGVLSAYQSASDSLQIIEHEDASDDVIKIRSALELLQKHAKASQVDMLSDDAAQLKKAFIKVYLLKG